MTTDRPGSLTDDFDELFGRLEAVYCRWRDERGAARAGAAAADRAARIAVTARLVAEANTLGLSLAGLHSRLYTLRDGSGAGRGGPWVTPDAVNASGAAYPAP